MIPSSFTFGPFIFHIYGLLIASSVVIGWYLARKRAKIYQIPQGIFEDWVVVVPLISALVGARIYHVVDKWAYYSQNPDQLILINNGGLGIFGALAGILAGCWILARIKKIKLLSFLDLIAPSIVLGQAIGRIGNYVNQEGFGPPTSLPWGVYIDISHRPAQYLLQSHFHPTFFYEAILDLIAFFILINFSKRQKASGSQFGLYLILYGVSRFIIEFWRIDTATVGEIKVAQVLSLAAILLGAVLIKRPGFFGVDNH